MRRGKVRRTRRLLCATAVASCATFLAGCGGSTSETAHLSGTVTLDGKPLPADAQGTIVFRPVAGGAAKAASAPIEKGRYDSPTTPKGDVKVFFSITKPSGRTFTSSRTGERVADVKNIVPVRYATGIDLNISADKGDQDFDLAAK